MNKQMKAYIMLRKKIYDAKFNKSDIFTESSLSEEFGISRTPIRSALEKLSIEGLIDMIPGKGYFYKETSYDEISDLFDIRIAFVEYIVEEVIETFTNEDYDFMNLSIEKEEECLKNNDIYNATIHDIEFHFRYIDKTSNLMVKKILNNTREKIAIYGTKSILINNRHSNVMDEHRMILKGFMEKNRDETIDAITTHLKSGKMNLIS